jgi:hypothetical protein
MEQRLQKLEARLVAKFGGCDIGEDIVRQHLTDLTQALSRRARPGFRADPR